MERLKVIYVDDDVNNVSLMEDLSDEFDWDFKGFTCGAEALFILNRESFDVIFSDLQMPYISGLELVDCIRNDMDNPNLKTPIFIITGRPDGKEAEICRKQDISGVIQKPFTLDALRDITERLMNNKIKYPSLIIQNAPFCEFKLSEHGYVMPDRCFILGQSKRAIVANYHRGYRYYVKFKPWGAHYFLGAPMDLFAEKVVGLENAIGRPGREICEKVLNAGDKAAAADILQDMIEKRIVHNAASNKIDDDENIIEIVKKVIDSKHITRVIELLETSYYGKRHMNRKFNTIIGLNPKTFIKIIRLKLCLENIRIGKKVRQELLLKEFGYYDRSHMIREFKDILRLTPVSYLEEYLAAIDSMTGYRRAARENGEAGCPNVA